MKNFKKAMKNFKKVRLSLGMKIIALLSCVALLSMGFASWWIVRANTETAAGAFTVYTVDEKNVQVTLQTGYDGTVKFGAPASSTTAPNPNYKWLKAPTGNDKVEDLSAGFVFEVLLDQDTADATLDDLLTSVDITFSLGTAETAYEYAIAQKYLSAPVVKVYVDTESTSAPALTADTWGDAITSKTYSDTAISASVAKDEFEGATTLWIKVEITFDWGIWKEGGTSKNPYDYFNAQNPADFTDADSNGTPDGYEVAFTALDKIEDINASSATTQYQLTVAPVLSN